MTRTLLALLLLKHFVDSQWHGQWSPSDKNRSLESAVFVF
jgi:hypothetical protein